MSPGLCPVRPHDGAGTDRTCGSEGKVDSALHFALSTEAGRKHPQTRGTWTVSGGDALGMVGWLPSSGTEPDPTEQEVDFAQSSLVTGKGDPRAGPPLSPLVPPTRCVCASPCGGGEAARPPVHTAGGTPVLPCLGRSLSVRLFRTELVTTPSRRDLSSPVRRGRLPAFPSSSHALIQKLGLPHIV